MTPLRKLTGLVVCGYLVWAAPAAADPVTVWNDYAVPSIVAAGAASRPGGTPTLDLAMVHAAYTFESPDQFRANHPPKAVAQQEPLVDIQENGPNS